MSQKKNKKKPGKATFSQLTGSTWKVYTWRSILQEHQTARFGDEYLFGREGNSADVFVSKVSPAIFVNCRFGCNKSPVTIFREEKY